MNVISRTIVVEPFVVHSTSCNWYILYLIAIDIKRYDYKFLTRVGEFDELKSLKITVHDGAFLSIEYHAVRGIGTRLPFIDMLPSDDAPNLTSPTSSSSQPSVSHTLPSTTSSAMAAAEVMLASKQYRLYNDICSVGERIVQLFDDDHTLRTHAINIAQYLLKCERMSKETVMRQLDKPGAKQLIEKLLACGSDLLSSDPRALGVDISNYIVSEKIQKSLDVKSVHTKTNTMMPKIKHTILHSHPTFIWIRFYTTYPDIMKVRFLEDNNYHISVVCENVYEFHINKTVHDIDIAITNKIINVLEQCYDSDIIFCSELQYFSYNKLLFISNYVKFVWCYLLDKQIFNPSTMRDFKTLCIYMIHAFLFLQSNNLAHMSTATHNPLIAYTGERPRTAINKFNTNTVYRVEGHRAMMTIGKSGDFGCKSNFVEIISDIEIDHSILDVTI